MKMLNRREIIGMSVLLLPISAKSADPILTDGEVNVLDYGADPSGVNDSTVEILNARDEAQIQKSTLFFPPGNYKVNSDVTKGPLLFESPAINIRGSGRHSQIFNNTGRDVFHFGKQWANYHDWRMRDLFITTAGGGHCVTIISAGDCLFEGVRFGTNSGPGSCIYMHPDLGSNAYGLTVRRCVFSAASSSGAPMVNIRTTAGFFNDNTIENSTFYGAQHEDNDAILIHADSFSSYQYNNRIKDIYFQGVSGHCVSLQAADHFLIENCSNYDTHLWTPTKDYYVLDRTQDYAYSRRGIIRNVSRGPHYSLPTGWADISFPGAFHCTIDNFSVLGYGRVDFKGHKNMVVKQSNNNIEYLNDSNVTYIGS